MTFDDIESVDVDEDAGTFTIIKKDGSTYNYFIASEYELFARLVDYQEFINFYSVEQERLNIEEGIYY